MNEEQFNKLIELLELIDSRLYSLEQCISCNRVRVDGDIDDPPQ